MGVGNVPFEQVCSLHKICSLIDTAVFQTNTLQAVKRVLLGEVNVTLRFLFWRRECHAVFSLFYSYSLSVSLYWPAFSSFSWDSAFLLVIRFPYNVRAIPAPDTEFRGREEVRKRGGERTGQPVWGEAFCLRTLHFEVLKNLHDASLSWISKWVKEMRT